VLLINVVATVFMTGLLWFIQVVTTRCSPWSHWVRTLLWSARTGCSGGHARAGRVSSSSA